MFKYKYFIIASLLFTFLGCQDNVTLSFSEKNITTSNNSIVEVNIPKAEGKTNIANQINAEIQQTVVSALHIGEPDTLTSESIEESITIFNNEYHAFKTDFPETEGPWEAQIDGDIMYKSPEIISTAISSYINTGGAHGLLNVNILNFDAKTGKRIENQTIFNNVNAFKAIAQKHFDIATKDKDIFLDHDNFELPANLGYSNEGIVLLYNTYEIAPYSTGIIQFTIPFEDVDNLLVFNSF